MGFRSKAVHRILTGAAAVLALASLTAAPAEARPAHGGYLALGDSVAFGYRPGAVTPPTDYLNPANFRGYAEKYASLRGLRLANASCPGETTASMLTPDGVAKHPAPPLHGDPTSMTAPPTSMRKTVPSNARGSEP